MRLAFSPSSAEPTGKLESVSEARAARRRCDGVDLTCDANPSSTRRRMASERVVSFLRAQSSTLSTKGGGMRDETIVPRPVAGRPRPFFWSTFIDFFMD
jgi:hypothetical protein